MSQAIALDYIQRGRNEFFISKVKSTFSSKAEYREATTHALCISGIEAAFGNSILQLPCSFANEQEISAILDLFKSKGLPFFWWEPSIPIGLKNEAPKAGLIVKDILIKNGLQVGGLLKGIYTHLHSIRSAIHPPAGVTIRKAQSTSDLKLFCQLVFSIHGVNEPHVIEHIYLLAEHSTQAGEEIHYLAYQEDQPIGGITLATGKKAAGLWNFATLASHRRQGIGSALIQAALIEAKKLDYQNVMAILMPSEMGQLWRQFHFQEVCHFPFYIGYGKLEQTSEEKSKRVRKKGIL